MRAMKRGKTTKIKIKVDHLKLSRNISRVIFKDVPMKEKTIKDKTKYTRKSKHKREKE
jgi:hypothetical protein